MNRRDDVASEEGEILWTSAKVEAIRNRENLPADKTLPEDPVFFPSNAGTHQHHIRNGKIITIGHQNRIYLNLKNLNVSLECMAIGEQKIADFSLKLGSFHDSDEIGLNKAYGGYGGAFDFKAQEAECKVEPFHNFHLKGINNKLPKAIEKGETYHYKVTRQNVKGKKEVVIRQYIEYELNGKWTKVNDVKYTKDNWDVQGIKIDKSDQKEIKQFNKAKSQDDFEEIVRGPYMSEGGRLWLRCNGEGDPESKQGKLTLWNIIVRKLDEL